VDDGEEDEAEDEELIIHLIEPDTKEVKSLFQDHLKFIFVFERVVELFVHHRRTSHKTSVTSSATCLPKIRASVYPGAFSPSP